MAVVNRCAVAIAPAEPLLAWARSLGLNTEGPGAAEACLYLLREVDSDAEAEEALREIHTEIFEAELDAWCRDPARWPEQRTYALFRQWFAVQLHPLIHDLVEEPPLLATPVDEELVEALRQALGEGDSNPQNLAQG
jgi:hypothetical protein